MDTFVTPYRGTPWQSGLTLIEQLMIMLVVAMLTAVAVPVYRSYANRPIINAAQQDLIRMAASLKTNSYEKSLVIPSYTGQVSIAALPSKRSGSLANDFAGWAPTQGARFNYSVGTVSDSTGTFTLLRATSTDVSVLPTSCYLDLKWKSDTDDGVARTADSTCGFTSW